MFNLPNAYILTCKKWNYKKEIIKIELINYKHWIYLL